MATIYEISQGGNSKLFMLWSKSDKKPISPVLEEIAFFQWYLGEYGEGAFDNLKQRMNRVKENGHSAINKRGNDLYTVIRNNKAGADGKHLSLESIIASYSLRGFLEKNIRLPPESMTMEDYVTWVIDKSLKPIETLKAIEDYKEYLLA